MPDTEKMVFLRRKANGELQEVGREPGSKPVPPGFLLVTKVFYDTFIKGDD